MPRQMNGPEAAQDYLFQAQKLWMESGVWDWARRSSEVQAAVLKKCTYGGCYNVETRPEEYKACAACKKVYVVFLHLRAYSNIMKRRIIVQKSVSGFSA